MRSPTLRWWLALAVVLAGATGARPAPAAARPVVLVGNLRAGTVTVVDETALKVLGAIDVTPDGKTPQDPAQAAAYPFVVQAKGVNYVQGLALSADGRTLYVSRGYLGDVAAFDVSSRRLLWRLEVNGIRADHVALSPDGARLFVSALTANQVQVIDTSAHAFVGGFDTGDWPHVLQFTPDGRYIVNGSLGNQLLPAGAPTNQWLTFADPRTLQVQRVLKFDAGVRPFVFSPAGSPVYVQFSFFNGFKVIDPVTGQILHTVNLPVRGPATGESPAQYPNQAAHHGLAISGDGRTICDAATVSNYVALVDRRSLRTRAIIPVGDQPADAETSTDGRECLVSNRGSGPGGDTLSVISYRTGREIARLPTGDGPQELLAATIPDPVLRAAGFSLPRPHPRRPCPRPPRHRHRHRHRRRGCR
jgi:DNA-binding beta-propeller fold protein YncE